MFHTVLWTKFVEIIIACLLLGNDYIYNSILYSLHDPHAIITSPVHHMGSLPHSSVQRILDGKPSPRLEGVAYGYLHPERDDCSRFNGRVRAALSSPHMCVRSSATNYLKRLGDSGDAVLILPLLYDDDKYIRVCAGQALESIGDSRTMLAIDVWLRTSIGKSDQPFIEYVRERRNAIEARLAGKPREPAKVNPYPGPNR